MKISQYISIPLFFFYSLAQAEDLPKQIEMITKNGAKVIKTFPAASQLKGWVIGKENRYTIVFTTADSQAMLAGELIDENGNNLTEQYAAQYLPKPDFSKLYSELERAAFIAEGTLQAPVSVVYIFFDPNCPYCHLVWKAMKYYESAGLQVRWIPVAYLSDSSTGKAAAILQAKNPIEALQENEKKFNGKKREGGIKPVQPDSKTRKLLDDNNELLQQFEINSTPALIWKDEMGKVHVKNGMPRLSELPAITRLPAQTINDPDLASYR